MIVLLNPIFFLQCFNRLGFLERKAKSDKDEKENLAASKSRKVIKFFNQTQNATKQSTYFLHSSQSLQDVAEDVEDDESLNHIF